MRRWRSCSAIWTAPQTEGRAKKARALAVYLTVFFGSMTTGSAIWGQIASRFGTPTALVVATLGMVLASATVFRWKLEKDPDAPQYIQTHIGVGYRMMKVE